MDARARALAAVAIAFAGAAWAAPATSLGTLFTTPQERERLDRLRRGEPETREAPGAARGRPTITGFVRRSDGRNTVWIDGTPLAVRRPGAGELLQPNVVGTTPDDETLRIERKPSR
ncbi:MAG: hypothetical protein ACXWF0_17385 [Usitatibacter sp.]